MGKGIDIIGYKLGELTFIELHVVTGDEGYVTGYAVGEGKVCRNPREFFLGVRIEGDVGKAFEGCTKWLLQSQKQVKGEGSVFVPKVAVEVHAPVIADQVSSGIESQYGSHQFFEGWWKGIEYSLFFTGEHAPVFVFIDYAGSQVPFQVTGVGAEGIDGIKAGLPALGDTSFFVPLEENKGFGEDAFSFKEFAVFFVIIAEEACTQHGMEAIGGGDFVGAVVVQAGEPFESVFFGSVEEGGVSESE